MTCAQRMKRIVEIVHEEEKINNDELLFLLSIELEMRVSEEKLWNETPDCICPYCGGDAPW